jgi:predicted RNA-binding protein
VSRVLYVPDKSFITEDVLEQAKKTAIAIQIGDSSFTQYLAFDRTKVNVVNIEKQDNFSYLKKQIKNLNQVISYTTGKYNFNKSIKCIVCKDDSKEYYNPTVCEKNFVSFIFKCKEIGKYNFNIEFENSILETGEFEVYEL